MAITALMIIGLFPALTSIPQAQAQDHFRDYPTCEDSFGSPVCVFLHPGVEDEYKPGWSHTLDTLWGTQSTPYQAQQRQVLDHYLDYAILASASDSVGDLQFDIQVLDEALYWISIYVPPEFTFLAPTKEESVWSDITNDYYYYDIATMSSYDFIAPDWTRVTIGFGYWDEPLIEPGIYHIRLFNVRAPDVAGLYHFKIYTSLPSAADPTTEGYYVGYSIGAGNYPFAIVKTELNPALISVNVRAHLNFGPTVISGRVMADGTTPEGRSVKGVAYWGPNECFLESPGDGEGCLSLVPGEEGNVYRNIYLFGLAAGTYTITAEGSGYSPTSTERIVVSSGQSLDNVFIVIFDSPDAQVTIFSKHGTGEIPWHNLWQLPFGTNDPAAEPDDDGPWRDILIDLYDSQNNLISFWASNRYYRHPQPGADLARKWFWRAPSYGNLLDGLHDDGGCIPTSTTFAAWLTDNYDLLGNPRGIISHDPSTRWDGHVPWDDADYIAGMPNGQYTVEAFVTGYIMDEADASQRTFTIVGTAASIQFDLRRSNWIEPVMHMPANVVLSGPTTVTLTAEDAGGNERASVAFTADDFMSADGVIDGSDVTDGMYNGGIVMEGWNAVFPNIGSSVPRGTGGARDINTKDYGLNPTASTHSGGAVALAGNPYTVKLYMSDMGIPYEGVQGTGWYNILGGNPQVSVFLCNSPTSLSFKIVNAWIWISLRSVDFEVPAHSRPWTFPGAEIWVNFKDTTTDEVMASLDPTIYGLFQDPGVVLGNGFEIPGGIDDGYTPFDIDNVNEAGKHEHLAVNFYGIDYCQPGIIFGGLPPFRCLLPALRSTRLDPGEYSFEAYTHGYVMRRSFPMQVPLSGMADIEADLIQGGQIRVIVNFKHEAVATDFNGFIRVEVFNADNEMVGASIYGQAQPNRYTMAGDGGAYLAFDPITDHMLVPGPAAATGLDTDPVLYPSSTLPGVNDRQRAFYSMTIYGIPASTWAHWDIMTPSDANRFLVPAGGAQSIDVYGFYWYVGGPTRTWAGGWPTTDGYNNLQSDYGLKGSNDIPLWAGSGGGLYTVKVWAFDPYGPDGYWNDEDDLLGAGDDWRMYQMAWPLENVEVPWGGAAALFVTMNNLASLRGTVRWFDMFGNLRALPWAQTSASPGPAFDQIPAYSAGYGLTGDSASAGSYIMWLPAGTHDISITTSEAPGVWSSSAPTSNAEYTVLVSDGWVGGGDSQLSGSGTPVPELPSFIAPLSLFAALAASVWLLRKRTLNAPILMK
jgi:hypothetical protein